MGVCSPRVRRRKGPDPLLIGQKGGEGRRGKREGRGWRRRKRGWARTRKGKRRRYWIFKDWFFRYVCFLLTVTLLFYSEVILDPFLS